MDERQLISHKDEKRRSFTMQFKLQVIAYARAHSNRSAAKKFNIEPKRVREWISHEAAIKATKKSKQKLEGGGRKCMDEQLEEDVILWIYDQRSRMLHVSRKMIMFKAKKLFDEKTDDPAVRDSFVASRGWCEKFMRRHGLSLRRKTTTAQKDPSFLIDRLVAYVTRTRRLQKQHSFADHNIFAMDETPVWNDMVSNTTVEKTGSKDVPMKTTGHEKVRVSVCLTARADGTKCRPFIVFAGAKRESKSLHEEFKQKCSVASSANGWMNEDLTLRWCDEILGQFSFQKRLLAWDSFEAHLTDPVKKKLKKAKFESVIIPGGCTKYIQAPDVVWNKPFKGRIQEFYDEWLSNGKHEYTDAGNMKPVPRRLVVEWVIQAWNELSSEMVAASMKSCALGLPVDGSKDEEISCFKKGKKCEAGASLLKDQTELLKSGELDENPFVISDEDIVEAAPQFTLIEDDEIDIDVTSVENEILVVD